MGFKLMSFNLDETLIKVPSIAVVLSYVDASKLMRYNKLISLLEKGEIRKEEALHQKINMLLGISISDIENALSKAPYMKGISEVIFESKLMGLKSILISENPDVICQYVAKRFSFDDYICSKIMIKDGKIVGVKSLLLNKLDGLAEYISKFKIDFSECLHIGGDESDVPIFEKVGFSVAINPKSENVRKKAKIVLDEVNDLKIIFDYLPVNQLD